ncbi:MAG: YchF/TatD family DNA exonuclease [Candidatus Eisenbacteria bacterium]|nr:YchF/TatD family DNA exonuclease [Candidatus Eisenbacteria bacterium]
MAPTEEGLPGPIERPLTDSHAHLNLSDYSRDREDVLARAGAAGVGLIINVGFSLTTSRESIRLSEEFDHIYATVGIHPHDADKADGRAIDSLRKLAGNDRVVAIGETGLDYYRDLSPREAQQDAFRSQISLARELGLPLVVHNRDALDDVLAIIDDEGASEVGGVMHCFPGDADYAREVVARGFHVGIGGPVTYSRKGRLVNVAAEVALRRLLLETDSPWLTPEPHRGLARKHKRRPRNEPAFVADVARTVASIRGMDPADLARATTGNAMKLFGIGRSIRPSIAYEMWGNLYLNITNRCTNECDFCVRYESDILWGYNLRLAAEPSVDEIMQAVGEPARYREIVFCGYGEPTVRLDVVLEVGRRLRESGARVRLDTNGHGNLIWNRNIVPELVGSVDAVSVSLNAQDAATYSRICHPTFGEKTFDHVLSFIRECRKAGLEVTASVVDVQEVDLTSVRALAGELGVPLKVRGGQ